MSVVGGMYVLFMHHLGHINKLYLRTQISKDVSWCMYVLRM